MGKMVDFLEHKEEIAILLLNLNNDIYVCFDSSTIEITSNINIFYLCFKYRCAYFYGCLSLFAKQNIGKSQYERLIVSRALN